MSASAPLQRDFSDAHAQRRAPSIGYAALLHAALWVHGAWAVQHGVQLMPRSQGLVLAAFAAAQVWIFWHLAQWLGAAQRYRGADLYLRIASGIVLVDALIRLSALLRGSSNLGLSAVPVFGPYSVIFGYSYLDYFARGTVLIALGYAIRRAPDETGVLPVYGFALIGMGLCYAAFMANVAIFPGVAADALLVLRFVAWPEPLPASGSSPRQRQSRRPQPASRQR